MECKEILKELIKFDTYKDKQNKEIMDYIQEVLEKKDFKVDYRSKCLVMSIKDNNNLAFIGHTDTVQAGNDWTYNPLVLTEEDDKLYGLGTCDMKGGIAAIIKAVLDIDWNQLKFGIKLIFTYDEEIGFEGIKEINKINIQIPENVIIGEPTNNIIKNGSKGLLEFKFYFKGKSAHSSNPSKGINAIDNCLEFLNKLKNSYNDLKLETDDRFKIPYTTMNIGKIEGGKSINIVPSECVTYVDFRVISNEHRNRIIKYINELKSIYNFDYEIINDIKPFISDNKKCITTNGITEASLIEAKNRNILGVGPVNPHEANEYITIDSLNKLVEQYKEIILKTCN